jgi:hypothetical protein
LAFLQEVIQRRKLILVENSLDLSYLCRPDLGQLGRRSGQASGVGWNCGLIIRGNVLLQFSLRTQVCKIQLLPDPGMMMVAPMIPMIVARAWCL